ncbi:hypothetical protein [Bifidobacterium sp. ESL0790]|uniref:hypothetical protein n=1 Tax=Bifidobacterium sp. ESL0790 TaxID=2983233 RepID=UPI0023F79D8C|nr:hypothetical protein [Bifidobacterium sp. ESL0790]WEV72798.1 hypothetical protein OZY47_02145 [Bifidobacterium sp. ESL0790]
MFYGNGGSGTPPPNLVADDIWFGDSTTKTIPGQGGLLRNKFRFSGWNLNSDGKGTHYKEGDTINLPEQTALNYDHQSMFATLYAEWKSTTPTITGAAPKADGVHVKGTEPAGIQIGDTFTVTDDKGHSATTTAATANDPAGKWEATISLPGSDTIGQGTITKYTAVLNQHEGGSSADSTAYEVSVDQVAPALENIRANTPAHQITGVAWSSGNTTAQPGRVKEGGDTITATWPGLGTTTTTTTSSAAGHEGEFTLPIPNGVTMPGDAVLTVSDTAGEHGLNGVSNKSGEYTARLTPPITVLPFTGGRTPATWALTIAISAILTLATGTILTKRAYAHTRPRH